MNIVDWIILSWLGLSFLLGTKSFNIPFLALLSKLIGGLLSVIINLVLITVLFGYLDTISLPKEVSTVIESSFLGTWLTIIGTVLYGYISGYTHPR
ncbi:MAG: hypothetical protein WCV88_04885 [Patescibacteria group bacterium]|jgi:hypothetical protein